MSRHCEVWVITYPRYRSNIERYLEANPNPNLHFYYASPPKAIDPWNPEKGTGNIRLHYLLWLGEMFKVAKKLHREVGFDLSHFVSWNTVSAPPPLWKLPIPFIWGSVGGGQMAPFAYRRYFTTNAWEEALRSLRVLALPLLPPVRQAVRRTSLILATNAETQSLLRRAGARQIEMFNVSGLPDSYVPSEPPAHPPQPTMTLLWAGRLESMKAPLLMLQIMQQVADLPVRLLVAGDGPLRPMCEAKAKEFGIEHKVQFLGRVNWHQMKELYRSVDAFLFTSLRDSFGSVNLEAMSQALPLIAFDHQGVGYFVPPEAAIKIPVTTPEKDIRAFAEGIRKLYHNPELRQRMGRVAWEYARSEMESVRTLRMLELYRKVLKSKSLQSPQEASQQAV
ncbi:glycosyltransferase family 4 protein [Meiothermus hypogaeus]|uniref:glycosyltransferase family 4 protein n=1 Tax=Meiothermus hypogaeus TaxID=884155 RepID=UPI0014742109|nr:glycosyltransferase family 4 protein [Meiothermus hypogaeus]